MAQNFCELDSETWNKKNLGVNKYSLNIDLSTELNIDYIDRTTDNKMGS
jgi:hypothetical protein